MLEEGTRVIRTRLFNPKWIEGMKRHGYKGARRHFQASGPGVYDWEATTEVVDGAGGDIQGGSIDAVTAKEVSAWREKMGKVVEK